MHLQEKLYTQLTQVCNGSSGIGLKGGEVATTRNYFVIKVPQPFDQIKVGGI